MPRVRLIFRSAIPRLFGARAITLYPFVFFEQTREEALRTRVLHHEWLHILQVRRKGFFGFYLGYVGEFFRHYRHERNWNKAYRLISYERDAYAKQDSFDLPENLV